MSHKPTPTAIAVFIIGWTLAVIGLIAIVKAIIGG